MKLLIKSLKANLLGWLASVIALMLLLLLVCQFGSERCVLFYYPPNPIERIYRHTSFGLLIRDEKQYRDGRVEIVQGWLDSSILNYVMVAALLMTLIALTGDTRRRLQK